MPIGAPMTEAAARFFSAYPNHDGSKVYLNVNVVQLQTDRFIQEHEVDIMVYDLGAREVVNSFKFPKEVVGARRPALHVSPDGSSLYVIGRDLYELDPCRSLSTRLFRYRARFPKTLSSRSC